MSDCKAPANGRAPAVFGVKLDRGVVRDVNGEPLRTWEQADAARLRIEETFGETGEVVEVLL